MLAHGTSDSPLLHHGTSLKLTTFLQDELRSVYHFCAYVLWLRSGGWLRCVCIMDGNVRKNLKLTNEEEKV